MSEFEFEQISVFLPQYLSPREQRGLFNEIKAFPEKVSYYDPSTDFRDTLMQGDGWRGLVAIDFQTLDKKPVSGVIISNSCDIVTANKNDLVPNILFAPLIRLQSFADLLKSAGKQQEYIDTRLQIIRRQQITSLFYFPRYADVIDESIIVLDDIHRHPLANFVENARTKLFTLTQAAFYLFLIKLSIHFHRINEGAHRHIPGVPAAATANRAQSALSATSSAATWLRGLAVNVWNALRRIR